MECLFCKIVNKEEPATLVYEDERFVVFKDIHPKAPFHVLIVPRKHIASVAELGEQDKELIAEMIFVAKHIAEEQKFPGYKLQFNVGRQGGQIVDHLHLHLLGYPL
ncbi:MAG: histidine triad nucleotide-binding protein [Candidatus Wildermuthbacteria bacterium]|nr:histidine triad nucleotide-binding protein [Candidatus Wildermuthbacteria bacterium]